MIAVAYKPTLYQRTHLRLIEPCLTGCGTAAAAAAFGAEPIPASLENKPMLDTLKNRSTSATSYLFDTKCTLIIVPIIGTI